MKRGNKKEMNEKKKKKEIGGRGEGKNERKEGIPKVRKERNNRRR